ncbi:PP2C family protein-serine/threonine phosphatase [Candidatus Peregrinibacteria bacterium]|nr:PP2C family protein-serine/threonine phosphatase [Candidatus Peregrinibacteria bacterium]
MKFLRDSLTKKALFLFTLLVGALVGGAVMLFREQVEAVSVNLFLGSFVGLLVLLFLLFLFDVVVPLRRVARQVRNLLTGKAYHRIDPMTIDEIGMFTHFFNEITKDLEKISYDVKERRRMSSELDIAAQIQRDVLPKEAPMAPGLDIVAKTRSAAEVGGDSFDFLQSPDGNQTFIYIGDVTGHGVPAGLVMVMVDTLIHAAVSMGLASSKDVLVHTNAMLTPRISARLFMTLVMLRWDASSQKMYYTGGGHEHVLVYKSKEEKVESIRSGGIALGMIPDNSKIIAEKEIPLELGDAIVLYTDGLTEAKNQSGEMYGLERMTASLKKYGYLPSAESIFDHMTQDFSKFVGEYVQVDDTTMIVIKYTGKDAGGKMKLAIAADESRVPNAEWGWGS